MNMKLIQALGLIALLTTVSAQSPSFCHGLDCPKYTVTGKIGEYEIRQYEPSKWVGTTITGTSYKQSADKGFDLLFDYIEGANKDGIKIPMASPVAVKIVPLGGEQFNYTVNFFVPFAYQSNTSIPTNPALSIASLPALTAYVGSFSGYTTDTVLKEQLEKIKASLTASGKQYVHQFSYTAGYDPPYRVIGRHNEVWLIAE